MLYSKFEYNKEPLTHYFKAVLFFLYLFNIISKVEREKLIYSFLFFLIKANTICV